MNKEKLICNQETLENELWNLCNRYEQYLKDSEIGEAENFQEPISNLAFKICKAKQGIKWIPVSERLPEKAGWYLVYDPFSQLPISEKWFTGYNFGDDDIAYWAKINLPEKNL